MSSTNTLKALESFCINSSGNPNQWYGNNGQYQWNLGRQSKDGNINGVVRKLVGLNDHGNAIWVVAGSVKIKPDGEILRFTGLSKAHQKMMSALVTVTAVETEVV